MFEFEKKKEIPDVVLVTPRVYSDDRGFFIEAYKKSEFAAGGIECDFVQDNYSHSDGLVLRGLHYQNNPVPTGKLVSVHKGKIFDVAVDVRKGSPWYGKWVGVVLSDENKQMLWVPEGFAHGFLTLSEEADVFYKCSGEYAAGAEAGIRYDDPAVGIEWPKSDGLTLSDKDAKQPLLADAVNNLVYST